MNKKILLFLVVLFPIFSLAQESGPQSSMISERPWRYGIGLGHSLTSSMQFGEMQFTTGATVFLGRAEIKYKNAAWFAFEGRNTAANSWGLSVGISHDPERDFDSVNYTAGSAVINTSSSGVGNGGKISFTSVYVNAIYQWEQIYVPFGLSLSAVKYSHADGYTGDTTFSGGFGGQLGLGVEVDNNWCFEALMRSVSVRLKGVQGTETVDFGYGSFSAFTIAAKYIF